MQVAEKLGTDPIVRVTLTWAEVIQAALVAVMRVVQNRKLGRHDRYGQSKEDSWTTHIEGACAELVFAKYRNRFWSGAIGDIDAKDVDRFQVRHTTHQDGRLLLHPDDLAGDPFVLITGIAPNYDIVGWLYAGEGKLTQFWEDPTGKGRPAFFVPRHLLHPIAELPE